MALTGSVAPLKQLGQIHTILADLANAGYNLAYNFTPANPASLVVEAHQFWLFFLLGCPGRERHVEEVLWSSCFFDDPFWVGVIELRDGATLRVLRHVFGAEPGHAEVLSFVLPDLYRLFWHRADAAIQAEIVLPQRRLSPKRAASQPANRCCGQQPKPSRWPKPPPAVDRPSQSASSSQRTLMQVYHLVARSNVDQDGWIIDPLAVRHGTLAHGQVDALAGPIDPLTHLNLDFTDHRLEACVIVGALHDGAIVQFTSTSFAVAYPHPNAFAHHGPVNQGLRRGAWQARLQPLGNGLEQTG